MGQLLLVRHGQASWAAADYDVLSETGWEQSRVLGRALKARGITPDLVVSGGMRRHAETAQGCLAELGSPVEATVDPGWDEFDHVSMLAKLDPPFAGRKPTKAEFQEWFEAATDRWTRGEYDHEYAESFTAFTDRVGSALRRTAEAAGAGGSVLASTRQSNGVVVIEVHDSGPGLSREAAATLFEPTITFKEQGMGLGLSIAKRHALLSGGDIVPVEGRLGGAAFKVTLPSFARIHDRETAS